MQPLTVDYENHWDEIERRAQKASGDKDPVVSALRMLSRDLFDLKEILSDVRQELQKRP